MFLPRRSTSAKEELAWPKTGTFSISYAYAFDGNFNKQPKVSNRRFLACGLVNNFAFHFLASPARSHSEPHQKPEKLPQGILIRKVFSARAAGPGKIIWSRASNFHKVTKSKASICYNQQPHTMTIACHIQFPSIPQQMHAKSTWVAHLRNRSTFGGGQVGVARPELTHKLVATQRAGTSSSRQKKKPGNLHLLARDEGQRKKWEKIKRNDRCGSRS